MQQRAGKCLAGLFGFFFQHNGCREVGRRPRWQHDRERGGHREPVIRIVDQRERRQRRVKRGFERPA